ncbi:ABC transporter ATP-binding protein [Vagococcus carniphilus]|uniref:ABC transporter ATP-binding protein n=1 Tax=Vagococcus carniphilus TaxID=218144 RepID=UPI0028918DD8|nr:ABC transporter ATP-binding protein [Vagococcus carniphilus]MDT2849022.1 ABC transporter ATP-binding protein [Vagococcus carniphilus]
MKLEVKNLSFAYPKSAPTFSNVNFDLHSGESLVILGPNGAGKSTLLNCLVNLLTPVSGTVKINDAEVHRMDPKEVAQEMGYVQQQLLSVFSYSVRDYVVMGRAPYLGMFSQPRKEDYEKVDQLLEEFGLSQFANHSYADLSGGQMQRVAIIRTLIQTPSIILLDEPTAHLDVGNQYKTVEKIKELKKQGYAVIMTTHNPDHALILDDKTGILEASGRFTFGEAKDVINEKMLNELYQCDLSLKEVPELNHQICVYMGGKNND